MNNVRGEKERELASRGWTKQNIDRHGPFRDAVK